MTVKVQFAPEKTKMITFSRSRELKTPPKVKFRSCTVCSVNELNYLGVVLDKKLSGLPHLQYVGHKTLAFFNSINGMRLHGSIKKELYSTMVLPMVKYACVIWFTGTVRMS